MFLRKLRWLTFAVMAVGALLAAPSRSRADVSVTVSEVDSGGNIVQSLGTFNSTPGSNSIAISNQPSNSFVIDSFNSTLNSPLSGTFSSISSSFVISIGSDPANKNATTFNPTDGLLFTVTGTNAANGFPGQPGLINQNASATSGIAGTGSTVANSNIGGVNQVTATTTVFGVTSPKSVAEIGDGSVSFPSAATTTASVAGLPNPYSVVQTILVYALPVNGNANMYVGATFTGGASSTVNSNAAPVPAPGGLILGLAALPLVGLRRVLARKSA
jgi:hypothetical protein